MTTPAASPSAAPAADDTPRPAASVVLLRDGADGLEVLLLRRHSNSNVLGGLYVFPGGKLDRTDCDPAWAATLDLPVAELHQRLAEPDVAPEQAMGLYLAALREMFEEAGVLMVEPSPGAAPTALATDALSAAVAARVAAGAPLAQALADLGLRWTTRAVRPWSRWITPRNPPVGTPRFDTRFFLAALPAGQSAQHDDHEAVDSVWLTPREALRRHWARELDLIPPQLMGLAQLARHGSVASAWAEAEALRPPCILPEHFMDGEYRAMCYPGDERHSVRERALPGPTRLRLVQRRFEPFDGFEGWFR